MWRSAISLALVCLLWSNAGAQLTTEGFEGAFPDTWATVGVPHTTVAGLGRNGTTGVASLWNAGWIYNLNASVNTGDRLSFWTYPLAGNATYVGVDAGPAGCKSFVFAPETDSIRIQDNTGYQFNDLAFQQVPWSCCEWYQMEVELQPGGVLQGRLLDSQGGLVGQLSHSFGGFTGGGVALRVGWGEHYGDDLEILPSGQAPTCAILSPAPGAMLHGDVDLVFDVDDPQGDPVTLRMEYSTDSGHTYHAMTPSMFSPLGNPQPAVMTPAPGLLFIWDSVADGVGAIAAQTTHLRVVAEDAQRQGQCSVVADVGVLPPCGDCDLNGTGPSIVDALVGAQIGASLVIPSPTQLVVCDVDGNGSVDVLDALRMAQISAGITQPLLCGGSQPPAGDKLYVLLDLPPELRVYDLATLTLLNTIVLPDPHFTVVADPVRDQLYLAGNHAGPSVAVVDTVTETITTYQPVTDLDPAHLAVTPDASALVGLTDQTGEMVVLDLPALTERHRIALPAPAPPAPPSTHHAIAISPSSQMAWTLSSTTDEAIKVDIQAGSVVTSVPLGAFAAALDHSVSGSTLWVTLGWNDDLVRIDTVTDQELAPRRPTANLPFGVLGHSNGRAYVMNLGGQNVTEHNAQGVNLRAFPVGLDPSRIRELPSGEVAVTNASSNSMNLIDPVSGTNRELLGLSYPLDVTGK